jgi:hypothetical protein
MQAIKTHRKEAIINHIKNNSVNDIIIVTEKFVE